MPIPSTAFLGPDNRLTRNITSITRPLGLDGRLLQLYRHLEPSPLVLHVPHCLPELVCMHTSTRPITTLVTRSARALPLPLALHPVRQLVLRCACVLCVFTQDQHCIRGVHCSARGRRPVCEAEVQGLVIDYCATMPTVSAVAEGHDQLHRLRRPRVCVTYCSSYSCLQE